MRKRLIYREERPESFGQQWLDLAKLVEVEVTSENDSHPIESALIQSSNKDGWRAAGPGEQTIRIVFDEPQVLRRILLVFEEHEIARSQEFVLRWSPGVAESFRDIIKHQWNFSPPGTVREVEDYTVQLAKVKVVELIIVPDVSGKTAIASITALRLA